MMPRTLDSVLQACMVMAVIVMSPYAMFATRGCAGGQAQRAPDAETIGAAEPRTHDEGADPEPGPAAPDAPPHDPDPVPGGYACQVPQIPIPRTGGCAAGEPYPACKWQIPEPDPGGPFAVWRYTTASHRWARPALVSLVLAAAREYASGHQGEPVTLGDLDAPGQRHRTHASGVDADLYLPGRMASENMGKGRWVDNYGGHSKSFVDKSRTRVLELAKILASCAGGRIRIYYNDPPVVESFLAWFGTQGLVTPFPAAMEPHNELHLFHFHITVPEDLAVLPATGSGED